MKKQEMINAIMLEEKRLWDDLQDCIKTLGLRDTLTDVATARWAAINKLVKTLGL
jgi:hypothetical protein